MRSPVSNPRPTRDRRTDNGAGRRNDDASGRLGPRGPRLRVPHVLIEEPGDAWFLAGGNRGLGRWVPRLGIAIAVSHGGGQGVGGNGPLRRSRRQDRFRRLGGCAGRSRSGPGAARVFGIDSDFGPPPDFDVAAARGAGTLDARSRWHRAGGRVGSDTDLIKDPKAVSGGPRRLGLGPLRGS